MSDSEKEFEKEQRKKVRALEKKVAELNALADTLQTCLRRAEVSMRGHEDYDYVFAQSARWAMSVKL